MKRFGKILERGAAASLFCLAVSVPPCTTAAVSASVSVLPEMSKTTPKVKSTKTVNSFATPDFAFPKTVEKNADARLATALSAGDWQTALRAAIQLDVASSLVSSDSFTASAQRFDSLANVMPAPWSGIALLLEARLYQEMYSASPWTYDNRTLPLTPRPENASEWSGEMFRGQVIGLVKKAFDNSAAAAVPLSRISELVTDGEDAIEAGMTLFDFMVIQADNTLAPFRSRGGMDKIPFGTAVDSGHPANMDSTDPTDLSLALVDAAVDKHAIDSNKFLKAYFSRMRLNLLQGPARQNYLESCVREFGDTPYCAAFISDYVNNMSESDTAYSSRDNSETALLQRTNELNRKKLAILEDYINRFPNANGIGELQAQVNSLRRCDVSVNFPAQLIPGLPADVTVNGSNLSDFYILIYSLSGVADVDRPTLGKVKSNGKLVEKVHVRIDGELTNPFTQTVRIPALTPGVYAFLPSTTVSESGLMNKTAESRVSTVTVSGLSSFTVRGNNTGDGELYIVSGINQKPLQGVKVTLTPRVNGKKGTQFTGTTDSEGRVTYANGEYLYSAETHYGKVSGHIYKEYSATGSRSVTLAKVLTDLSVYHPGDTVRFSAIAYQQNDRSFSAVKSRAMLARLSDANGQKVDSLSLTTDNFGRLDGLFIMPKTGLLGNWSVRIEDDGKSLGTGYFNVAEYKTPSFLVTVDSSSESFKAGDVLTFGGRAATYAGVPVAGGKVSYTVEYRPLWWWRGAGPNSARYGGQTETGADGSFCINLPTEGLKDTPYARGSYTLRVSVSDAAGETQEASALNFGLGSALRIDSDVPSQIEADSDSKNFKVTVYDIAGHPVQKKLYYDLSAAGGRGLTGGEFDSPNLRLDLKDVPSGRYELRISVTPDFKDSSDCLVYADSVTVWRDDDKRPPVVSVLWIPQTEIVVPAHQSKVSVRVGSSYDNSYVLALVSDTKRKLRTEWLRVSNGFADLTVDAPADNERIFVELLGERDLTRVSQTVTVIPHVQNENLRIEAESFRDRIDPGAAESWKFRFSVDGKECTSLPVMAVMSNKALNALAPFQWAFNPYGSLYWSQAVRFNYNDLFSLSNSATVPAGGKISKSRPFTTPEWNTYGYSLYCVNSYRVVNDMFYSSEATSAPIKVRGSRKMAAAARAESSGIEEAADEVVLTGGVYSGNDTDSGSDSPLRNTDVPLAFFKPTLLTDSDGVASVDFTAPDFVGTWQFQILGYTPDMRGSVLTLDAVASKRVMAQLNAPRFARTGDCLSVAATLYNNSDTTALVTGRMELIDALDGKVLLDRSLEAENVAASGSRVVSVEYVVPSDIQALTIRVYATVPGFSDGEQTVVPVLPSSAPVVESTPFYIGQGAESYSVRLPEFEKGSKVTLSYCDNPVWECVTALPSMVTSESANILSQANALFGNAVAAGLFAKYPALLDGVREMSSQTVDGVSRLESPLQRNPQLKTVLLNNTPWVNDAQSETLRMQSLVEYADTAKSAASITYAMKTLVDRQNGDGGWSWCPGMESSGYMTRRVLHTLASLSGMDCLPEGGDMIARKACAYIDRMFADDWNRSKRKNLPVEALLNYLYDKSRLKDAGTAASFRALDVAVLKAIREGWRNFGVACKATAALLLESRGDTKLSHTILESLRQFASVSNEKGMWFDNEVSAGDGALPATARVLEAYAVIEPENPSVDLLRQWLVVSKQTQNWGDNRQTAEVVNALLTSGSDWTVPASSPRVTLGGKPIDTGMTSAMTGAFTVDLSDADVSGAELTVSRSGNGPAWGGVVAQYVAPIVEVKAVSVPQLSVSKKVYALTPGSSGAVARDDELKVGDRVRVTLTLTCDRNIEYVAITDPRAACLEPVEQLSAYTRSDGVWFYREVRDASTNLFIPVLTKGTHVISYECDVDREGDYTLGVATAQSQYAPEITAHSAGGVISVR